ncbi:hypothetical protein DERP_014011 [Dermatophagoides pteronyssinus]|uniref:Uncharacterized protein n=1 Tax=Dermatophagoides pteronyssinus TaxID=6956 RepID=A0ABQ8JD97_DERPT|nr:hypothetical protein DERP_014011 [Dermatophagoides pteronyssinus]
MQNIRTFSNQLSGSIRSYSSDSNSLLKLAMAQWNKFWYGGEQPYKSRDIIYEDLLRDGKSLVMHRYLQKILYARHKARTRYVKHNEHIRKLEDKISAGGMVKPKSFANRF